MIIALLASELEGLLGADPQPLFQQWYRLIRQQLPHRDLQLLTPAVGAGRPKIEDMTAVADPTLLG